MQSVSETYNFQKKFANVLCFGNSKLSFRALINKKNETSLSIKITFRHQKQIWLLNHKNFLLFKNVFISPLLYQIDGILIKRKVTPVRVLLFQTFPFMCYLICPRLVLVSIKTVTISIRIKKEKSKCWNIQRNSLTKPMRETI